MRTLTCIALLAALVGATAACTQSAPDTIKSESTSKVQTPEGTKTTATTTEQVGSTVASTTDTKVKTPDGTVESKTETVVGTVSAYTAGKKIEIITGDNSKHSYDLDDTKVVYHVDPSIQVGSKVRLVQSTNDSGAKVIEVTVRAA